MNNFFLSFLSDEEGAGSVEYAIIASLIGAVIVITVSQLGTKVVGLFNRLVTIWL